MTNRTILIAHNYTTSTFAGMSYHLAHHLARNGWKVIFISHRPFFRAEETFENGNLVVTSWKTEKRPTGFDDFIHFSRIYLKYKPEVVIGHFVGGNISNVMAKVLSLGKCKTYEYYHTLTTQIKIDSGISMFKFYRKKLFYKYFVDWVLPNSEMAALDFQENYKLKNFKSHVTPLADRYVRNKGFSRINQSLKIGFIGRLNESKGIQVLIEVVKELNNGNFEFIVAGSGPFERELQGIKQNNFKFLGQLEYSSVDAFISDCDLILVPSVTDNLVTVGIESLMNETLLVISSQTGLSSYLKSGEDCLIVEPNCDEIVKVLNWVNLNRNEISRIAIKGRQTYKEQFDFQTYFKFVESIIY